MFKRSITPTKQLAGIGVRGALLALAASAAATCVPEGAVAAPPQLTVSSPPQVIDTSAPITFTGTISPAEIGAHVVLQRLSRGGHWHRIAAGYDAGPGGAYSITHVFRVPSRGVPTELRVVLPRRVFGVRVRSEPFAVTITRLRHPVRHRHSHREERRRRRIQRREEQRHHREEQRHHRQQIREERRKHRQQVREEKRRRKEERRKLHHAHRHG